MRIPPLDVILSWPTPDYEHPQTRGEALLVIIIIFSILVLAAVAGRFYSRLKVSGMTLGWDDSFIALALIFTLGMNITVILANNSYGWNRHLWEVEVDMYQNAGIVAFCAKLLFVQAATWTRVSLILFYYRLVRDSGISWFTYVLHGSMAFIIGLGIAFTAVGIWLCTPIAGYWAFPPIENSHCLDEGVATLIIGVFNCVADLLTTVLPIPLIMRLRMPMKHRIGVCILLSLGFIVTIAGAIRTYFIWKSLMDSWDVTWYSYPLWICAAIEIDLAVICACAPALKPLLHKPIVRMSSRISSKISSVLRSRGSNSQTSSDKTSSKASVVHNAFCFRKGDEDTIMLQRSEQSDKSGMQVAYIPVDGRNAESRNGSLNLWSNRRHSAHAMPTLQIMKRQSLEQEISYLDPKDPAATTPERSETFGFHESC